MFCSFKIYGRMKDSYSDILVAKKSQLLLVFTSDSLSGKVAKDIKTNH